MKQEPGNIVSVEGLCKSFGDTHVLQNINFSLSVGGSLAILGLSGSGKSTLLRIIAGLENADSGKVSIDSKIATDGSKDYLRPYERGISMVFQDLGLWPSLSVLENTLLGLNQIKKFSRSQKIDQARSILERLDILKLENRKPNQISGGEQQRVALARAMVSNPRVLLFDEPFTGLDLIIKESLFEEIAALLRTTNTSLILVSHDPFEARDLCNRVLTIEQGAVVDIGSWTEVHKEPKSKILKTFAASKYFTIP
jgi:ABC-type sugar transport system ATPase subunit